MKKAVRGHNWPSEKEFAKIRKKMEKVKGALLLDPDAGPAERFKYQLCERLVTYALRNKVTQRQLAKILEIDEARVSEIVRYRFKRYSADRLMSYVEKIDPKAFFQVA